MDGFKFLGTWVEKLPLYWFLRKTEYSRKVEGRTKRFPEAKDSLCVSAKTITASGLKFIQKLQG